MSKSVYRDESRITSVFKNSAIISEIKKSTKLKNKKRFRYQYAVDLLEEGKLVNGNPKDEDKDSQHYWIATIYTLLMSDRERRTRAAYFTPPPLCKYLLSTAEHFGANFTTDHVLDPAAGGAAFLSSTAVKMMQKGCSKKDILTRIHGIEIDHGLASLAGKLIGDRLEYPVPSKFVKVCDSLDVNPRGKYDLVLANPPYGRLLKPSKGLLEKFKAVINKSHVNLYVLFIYLSVLHTRAGGLTGLIVPLSFIGGPAFANLRTWLFENTNILRLDLIEGREGIFLNVKQDTCILFLQRKSDVGINKHRLESGKVTSEGKRESCGRIIIDAKNPSMPWRIPAATSVKDNGSSLTATLADYGYSTKTGYFVWNREKHRVHKATKKSSNSSRRAKKQYPLIWAKNIRQNSAVVPKSRDGLGVDFVMFSKPSSAVILKPCLILQRTTNSKQVRRLVVARVTNATIKRFGGVVSENHTILLQPIGKPELSLKQMCELLGTLEVDSEFRRMSGTVNISTVALRELKLPPPDSVKRYIKRGFDVATSVKMACLG